VKRLSSVHKFILFEGSAEREGDTGDKTFCPPDQRQERGKIIHLSGLICPRCEGSGDSQGEDQPEPGNVRAERQLGARAAHLREAMRKLDMAQSARLQWEFPCLSVDLQVPIHHCKEIIKSYLPSKVLKLSFSFPLINEPWEVDSFGKERC